MFTLLETHSLQVARPVLTMSLDHIAENGSDLQS